jgi:coenzyme F420-reducing hydrogenase gamma subunit
MPPAPASRPRIGVVKLASCDGCQLTLLDCEDELLALCEHVDLVEFPEATSARSDGPFDILLVEGSVSAPGHAERLAALRAAATTLVAIGACATAGGIQAMRNFARHEDFANVVYPRPELVPSLATSTPVSAHVKVDLELTGCPIDKRQLLDVVTALLHGRRPQLGDEAVCVECKRQGNVCVMSTAGTPCLGQVTRAGCGALCPRYGRGCYGCFGPRSEANVKALLQHFEGPLGMAPREAARQLAMFTAWAHPYREPLGALAGTPRSGGDDD